MKNDLGEIVVGMITIVGDCLALDRAGGADISDEIRAENKAAAKALCHYPSGPSSVNSCCQGIPRCEMDAAIAEITRLRAALATARREVEQERDEFFNRLGRITEYLDIPVDATAQRIIEAIQERVDSERESCASVEVRLAVPEGAETWTPLEAWEEALLAFDEAFRETIRAAAKEDRQP